MKTTDAFAFRELYALIKPMPKKPDRAHSDAEKFQFYFFRHYQTEYISANSIAGIVESFERNEYAINQVEVFIRRIKNHIRRLGLIYSAKTMKRQFELVQAYKSLLSAATILLDGFNRQYDGGLDYIKSLTSEIFRQRLRTARKAKGFTGTYLADYLRIHQRSYSQYETGRAAPSMSTLAILARKLNVSVDWLLGLTD